MTRAAWLTKNRVSLRLSLDQLADRTGIALHLLSEYSAGRMSMPDPTYETLRAFFAEAGRKGGGTRDNAQRIGDGYVMRTATGWYVTPIHAGEFPVRTFKENEYERAIAYARNPVALTNPYPLEYAA